MEGWSHYIWHFVSRELAGRIRWWPGHNCALNDASIIWTGLGGVVAMKWTRGNYIFINRYTRYGHTSNIWDNGHMYISCTHLFVFARRMQIEPCLRWHRYPCGSRNVLILKSVQYSRMYIYIVPRFIASPVWWLPCNTRLRFAPNL